MYLAPVGARSRLRLFGVFGVFGISRCKVKIGVFGTGVFVVQCIQYRWVYKIALEVGV